MRIFNREQDDKYPLFDVLREMYAMKDQTITALACNFGHETGVSPAREQAFLKLMGTCNRYSVFEKRRKDYVNKRVKVAAAPEFRKGHNDENIVPSLKEKLVCVFLVNGLGAMFQWARDERHALPRDLQTLAKSFTSYPNADYLAAASINFINDLMVEEKERAKFIQAVFRLYEQYRIDHHYHPMWLTKWQKFEDLYQIKDGDRWCHLVGVSTAKKGKMWVLALVFDPKDLGPLYRPTVLDGDSSFFFPVPEGGTVASGLAADLKMAVDVPAAEYISMHPSLQSAALDYVEGCVQLREPLEDSLEAVREYHLGRLRTEFTSKEASAWIDRVEDEWKNLKNP
ncbi:MAG TPA: hypothetical protein VNB54_13135 [Alphaproteobacteria bacterium]|nr:hypothetical protein [Alphaproteobacteria bacterium]